MTTCWVAATDRQKLAKDGRAVVRIDGKQIALFDTPQGVFACNNRCPHEGYPLREGTLDEQCRLTCNWHNWKFDLKTGISITNKRLSPVRTYRVEVDGDFAILSLAASDARQN